MSTSSSKQNRKLSAILFADIVGYTALMQKNEALANQHLDKFHSILKDKVASHRGQVINNYGDGCVCAFDSSVDAMNCAREVQSIFLSEPKVPVRLGLHSGDVFFKDDNVYGDSVNIASRIESLGLPGAVLFSERVKKDIENQPDFAIQSLGGFDFKNVEKKMEVFALTNDGFAVPRRDEMKGKIKQPATRKTGWLVPAIIGIALLIAGGYYLQNQSTVPTAPAMVDAITIFPFDINSGNPDIQYLGKGMVDLISTKLEGFSNLNPIDPNRVFNQLVKANEEVPVLESATEISNTLGAAEFVLGSIIEINDALQISASKYDTKGELMAKETIEGQKTQLASLIDDLTRRLISDKLEEEGQELNSIAMMTSENLPALKAYLEGEQAFRKTEFREAVSFFQTAVSLDSTFAMAWLKLHNSRGWAGGTFGENFLDKAIKYGENLPPKWQDIIKVQKLWETGMPSTENMIAGMLRKYGENPELTNLMAEHIFHFYPIHGRPFTEAKPWLEKSRELDPQNLETLRHLGDIAWAEGDEVALQKIMNELPTDSRQWILNRIRLLTFQDSISETQIEQAAAHPNFRIGHFWPREAIPENPNILLELGLQFASYTDIDWIPFALLRLRGQDKKAVDRIQMNWETDPPDNVQSLARTASIISGRNYLPYEDLYPKLLEYLADYEDPQAYFASAKYAWALGKEDVYQENKNKLADSSKQSQGIISPARYYYWSLAAFEARLKEDYDKALICIDSAFSYSPTESFQNASAVAMDKTFMLADIYEHQQDYEKSIQRLENLPMWRNYLSSKGYATYRLSQLYEKSGDIKKALAKCNLFLRNYKDCDEKYRPWWDEVAERQKRLMDQVN